MTVRISGPLPVDEGTVSAAERDLGATFPPDFRGFLLEQNGGEPEPNSFAVPAAELEVGVSGFLGLGRADLDLLESAQSYADRTPSLVLPIAETDVGDLVCLSLRREDFGTVYHWDHEREADEGELPTGDNLTRLAGSFGDFLVGLQPDDETEDDWADVRSAWIDPDFLKSLS